MTDRNACLRCVGLLSVLAGIGGHGQLLAQQTPAACTFDTAAHRRAVAVTVAVEVLRGDEVDSALTARMGEVLRAGAPYPGTITNLLYPFTYFPVRDSLNTSARADVFGELHFVAATKREPKQIAWTDSTADPATNLLVDSLLQAADRAGKLGPLWAAATSDRHTIRLQLVDGTGRSTASPLVHLTVPMLTLDQPAAFAQIVLPLAMLGRSSGWSEVSLVIDESGQAVPSSLQVSSDASPADVAAAIASTMRGRYSAAVVATCPVTGRLRYWITVRK